MKAFILGAGLGTRLRPLTSRRPKPLVPLWGKPLITFAFDHLLVSGADSLVVNTHHCPEAYDRLLGTEEGRGTYRERPLALRHEPVLLDTGGGISNVRDLLDGDDFFVYNGDVLADFPLEPALRHHREGGFAATLILRSSGGPLHIQCDPSLGRLTDIRSQLGAPPQPSFLFTGISILSQRIFDAIPSGEIVSIIPIYRELIRQGVPIGGWIEDSGLWLDLGTRDAYLDAHSLLAREAHRLSYADAGWRPWAMSADAFACADPTAFVGDGARLEDSVVWENARIAPGVTLRRCVVTDGAKVAADAADQDF